MNKEDILEYIFLLPATIILGPPLLFFVFIVLPFGVLAPRDFPGPLAFLQLLFITGGPLLGIFSAWFIKFYGADRVRRVASIRVTVSIFLTIGIASGIFELLWIVMQKRNGLPSDLFIMAVALPALVVGIMQLFRIVLRASFRWFR